MRLVRFAKKHKVTYSRYADDITFSTSQRTFPLAIAVESPAQSRNWEVGEELAKKIKATSFVINTDKTRMQCRGSRQMVTGLVVNAKVNVSSEYFRNAKAMCRTLFNEGRYYTELLPKVEGEDDRKPNWQTSLNPIQGVLNHIFNVKRFSDRRIDKDKRDEPDAIRKLFRKFLFYRYFLALGRPLIVAEGKTDNIYIREAIRRLPQFQPLLGASTDKGFELAVQLFRYTKKDNQSPQANDVLDVNGGAGDFKSIILDYHRILPKMAHRPMLHPVILILDNDDGLQHVVGTIKKNFGITISKMTTEPFYHITHNLYVVKTPENGTDDTCIESLFPQEWFDKPLNGKKFNPNKKHGADGEYGKSEFADKVIRPNAGEIDFSGFTDLLGRILTVIQHYVPDIPSSL